MNLNFKKIAIITFVFGTIFLTTSNVNLAYAASAPDAITDLIAIPHNGSVELVWTAPFDNGSPISSYKVISWKTGSDVFTTYPNLSTFTSATITGLTNGVSYSFKVVAVNSNGQGPDSNIVSASPVVSPSSVPDAIIDLKAVREDKKVKLTWSKPFDNGATITNYKISYWQVGLEDIRTKTVTSTNAQITGLTNEVPYAFKVVAVNSLGHGPDSNIVSATPSASVSASAPNQVRGVTAIPSNGQVFLSWIQPSANGSPITSYKVIVSELNSNVFTTYPNLGSATQTTITGLTNGVTYTFKIAAINAVGTGKESNTISTSPNNRVPIEVTNLKALPGNGKVTLSWTVPSSALDKITSYKIREYRLGSDIFITHPILSKSTTATITGLQNGVVYGFNVIAVSADGNGPTSKTVQATPYSPTLLPKGIPKSIADLSAVAGDGKVSLSWTKPDDGGWPITGYNVLQYKSGSNSFTTYPKSSASTSTEMKGLTNGVTYTFKVTAVNAIGEAQDSNTAVVTPLKAGQNLILPTWVKTNAKWWAEGKISDFEYAQAIQYLLNQGIIKIG